MYNRFFFLFHLGLHNTNLKNIKKKQENWCQVRVYYVFVTATSNRLLGRREQRKPDLLTFNNNRKQKEK